MNHDNKQKKQNSGDPLRAFYESYATPDRDMTILEGAPKKIPFALASGVLVLLAVLAFAAWTGYQFFSGGDVSIIKMFTPGDNRYVDVQFGIDRETVVANGIISATLTIKNIGANPLDRLSTTLTFPDGFHYLDASPVLPKNEQHTFWELGVLKSGEEITLAIRGRMDASDESEKQFEAVVYYQPVNLSSEFKVETKASVVVKRSPFRLRIEGNETVEQGKRGEFQVKYHESAESYTVPDLAMVRPLQLRISVPPGLEHPTVTPKPSSSEYIWDLSELENFRDPASPDTRVITLSGILNAPVDSASGIRAVIGYQNDSDFIQLDETVFIPQVVAPEEKNLVLRLLIDGLEVSSLPFTQTGENTPHTIAIEYENKGTKTFLDTAIHFVIPATPYLLSAVYDDSQAESGQISYDSEHGVSTTVNSDMAPILAALAPGQKGVASVRVRTLDPITYRSLYEQGALSNMPDTLPIQFSATIGGVLSASGEKQLTSRSVAEQSVSLQFNSDTSLALRYDVRRDPLTTTTYEWNLENTRHALSGITIKATLPDSAVWSSQTSVTAGDIRYLPDTREVIWTINRLPQSVRAVSARFTVEGDFSSPPLPIVTVDAKDATTGGAIRISR